VLHFGRGSTTAENNVDRDPGNGGSDEVEYHSDDRHHRQSAYDHKIRDGGGALEVIIVCGTGRQADPLRRTIVGGYTKY